MDGLCIYKNRVGDYVMKYSVSPLEKILISSLKEKSANVAMGVAIYDFRKIEDYRVIQRMLRTISHLPLIMGSRPGYRQCKTNMLNDAMLKSFVKAYSTYSIRDENMPYLDKGTLQAISEKISFVIKYIHGRATLIAQDVRGYSVSIHDLCEAICDCVFYGMAWTEEESIPLIRNILNSQCFGSISLYRTNCITEVIKSKSLKHQSLSSQGNEHCWLRYVKYIKNRRINKYNPQTLYSKAKHLPDNRNPEGEAIVSELINYLGIKNKEHKCFLRNEPTILEFAHLCKRNIPYQFIPFTLRLILSDLQYIDPSLKIARGILSIFYIMSDKSIIEDILISSDYAKEIARKSKRPLGINKNIDREYMTYGVKELMDYLPKKHKKDYRFCKTREFFHSLFKSTKKSLNCKEVSNT